MTTLNITTSTGTINIYYNTDQTINPNMYIPPKVCKTCRTIQFVTEFYKDKTRKDKYKSICKDCDNSRKKYYTTIKNEINQDEKEYYTINKDKACSQCNQVKILNLEQKQMDIRLHVKAVI